MKNGAVRIVIVDKCFAPGAQSVITNSALNKFKNKLTIRKINIIYQNRFDLEILDISVGLNSSTAFAAHR